MTTTRPGSTDDAEGDTREPTGSGSFCFEADGSVNVNVSGDCEVELYGQTMAWVAVRERAYPNEEEMSACWGAGRVSRRGHCKACLRII